MVTCLYILVSVFVVFVCVLLFFVFLKKRKGLELGEWGCGEDLGGVWGWESVIRIYCMEFYSIKNLFLFSEY